MCMHEALQWTGLRIPTLYQVFLGFIVTLTSIKGLLKINKMTSSCIHDVFKYHGMMYFCYVANPIFI